MIKNKKADGIPWFVILLIISVFGLTAFLGIIFPRLGEVAQATERISTESNLKLCERESAKEEFKEYPDSDSDGLKDFCDNCPLVPNKPRKGQTRADIDPDGDLFPTGCCGNAGMLEYQSKNGKKVLLESSLPCHKKFRSPKETYGNELKPNKHPMYTWNSPV